MNWTSVKELVKINFLYANPQALGAIQAKQAKKSKKRSSALKSLRNQFLFSAAVFFLVYSAMFIAVDYSKSPGYFSLQLGLFTLIALVMGFTSLFSVFYDSKDTKLYLSLPVKAEEVYLAKLLAAQGTPFTYLLPLLSLLVIAYWQTAASPLALLLVVPVFLLLMVTVNAINLIILHFIGEVLAKSRHKKLIANSLMGVSTLLSIGLLLGLQFITPTLREGRVIVPDIPYFIGYYHLLAAPFGKMAALHFWLPLAILGGLVTYIFKVILPNYFNQLLRIDSQSQQTRKGKTSRTNGHRTVKQTLIRHHLSTIQDGTLLIQAYLMPLIFTFSMAGPALADGDLDLSQLDWTYYGIALLAGLIFGDLTGGPTSLLGVGISLEREQLTFIRTLPVNFAAFLRQKYWLLLTVQVLPIFLIQALFALIVLKLSWILVLAYGVGIFLSSNLMGQVMYRRDYRLLHLNWQNITQLYNRGNSNWLTAGIFFLTLVVGMVLMVGSIIMAQATSPATVSFTLLLLTLLLAGLGYAFVNRPFHRFLTDIEHQD